MIALSTKMMLLSLLFSLVFVGCSMNPQPIIGSYSEEVSKEVSAGWSAGVLDAQGNPAWGLAGVGCGLFGVGGAYYWDYRPPTQILTGKSPEYSAAYIEAYQRKMRNTNASYAMLGWMTWLLFFLVSTDL